MISSRIILGWFCLSTVCCVTAGDVDLFERVEVETVDGCTDPVELSEEVLPEIENACGFCHVSESFGNLNFGDASGKLTAESFVETLVDQPSLQSDKPLIESGSEAGSYFVDRVLQRDASIMPPGGPSIDDDTLKALRCWIEQGATLEDD